MSYCRWSSDNFKSDVYVYETDDDGFCIHIAGNRLVEELPPDPMTMLNTLPSEEWMTRYRQWSDALKGATRVPIKLPFAGETLYTSTLRDLLQVLVMLVEYGYHVPGFALRAIKEEIEDEERDCDSAGSCP